MFVPLVKNLLFPFCHSFSDFLHIVRLYIMAFTLNKNSVIVIPVKCGKAVRPLDVYVNGFVLFAPKEEAESV